MGPSAAVYALLSGAGPLVALVDTRVYPGSIPQDKAYPFVAFVRLDEAEDEAMGQNADILETGFEVTSVGADYDSCESVHECVRNALRRYHGTAGGIEVADILLRGGEGPIAVDEPLVYEATQVVAVRYRRA